MGSDWSTTLTGSQKGLAGGCEVRKKPICDPNFRRRGCILWMSAGIGKPFDPGSWLAPEGMDCGCQGCSLVAGPREGSLRLCQVIQSQPSAYFSGFEVPGFLFKSLRSLLRPNACLLVARSSKEMKCTGMPKKVLATLFLHAAGNLTPLSR